MGRRWFWLGLVLILVAGGVAAGWVLYGWDVAPPPPVGRADQSGSKIDRPIKAKRFEASLALPSAQPNASSPSAQAGGSSVISGSLAPPSAGSSVREGSLAPPPGAAAGAEAEQTAQAEPPVKVEPPAKAEPSAMESLSRRITVQGVEIPPPGVVPPFSQQDKPLFILETERLGRVVTVRGTTNLAIEGNGVQVSLFRVYKEEGASDTNRAEMDRRNLGLWFEGRFPVDDRAWLLNRLQQHQTNAAVFPKLTEMDGRKVYVEILFTANRADVGTVPGLTTHPIPGTDKQVYRIVRPVQLPLTKPAQGLLAKVSGRITPEPPPAEEPVAEPKPAPEAKRTDKAPAKAPTKAATKPPPAKPGGPTRIIIKPLIWLDGPRTAALIPSRGSSPGAVRAHGATKPQTGPNRAARAA